MEEARKLVLWFFKGDKKKTDLWFDTKNPLLGNVSPNEMIRAGRRDKLISFIENQLSENERDESV